MGCDAANRSHAGSLAAALSVPQPRVCVHRRRSPQTDCDLLPDLLPLRPSPGVTDPAVTPRVPGLPPAGLAPHAAPAAPVQSPPEPGCYSPRAEDGGRRRNSAGRSSAPRRGCGAAVRGVSGGRGQAACGPSRAPTVAVPAAAPLGEVGAGGASRHVRGALSGGGGRWRDAARAAGGCECSRLSPAPRAAAHPALGRRPGASENAERGRRPGSRPLGAPTRSPFGPSGEVVSRLSEARPAASWAALALRAAAGPSRGRVSARSSPRRSPVPKCSSLVSSAPPPIYAPPPPMD